MCQLATIHIDNPYPYPFILPDELHQFQDLTLPKSASINRIYISYPHSLDFRLECATTSVTHVELGELPVDFAVEFLLRCPNLIDFSYVWPQTASQVHDPRILLTSPLVLSHLSTFTLPTTTDDDYLVSDWDIVLFEHIHLPALERFNWWHEDCLSTVCDTTIPQSLSRFPNSVTTLELHELFLTHTDDVSGLQMFLSLTGVSRLRLHCNSRFVENTFSVLSRKEGESDVLFPKLTSIVVAHGQTGRWSQPRSEFGESSGDKVAEMLQSRVGLMDRFTLVVESNYLIKSWREEVWYTLQKPERDGLDLTIIEGGHPITI